MTATVTIPDGMTVQHFNKLEGVPDGPWTGEPDKAQWVDAATGYDCLVVRGPMGALCGYVGIPFEHQLHGADYDDVHVTVHGGLTFASLCDEEHPDGICHVPAAGRPANVWWLGFDCGHWRDVMPLHEYRMRELERSSPIFASMPALPEPEEDWLKPTYKPLSYVVAECAALAAQLKVLESAGAPMVE